VSQSRTADAQAAAVERRKSLRCAAAGNKPIQADAAMY
jgi:hypothetical protein